MKVLVLYASHDGHTARIAERMRAALARAGHDATVLSARDPRAGDAIGRSEAVIVGGALRAGRHARYLEKLVRARREALAARPNAFFSVSLSAHGNAEQRAEAERCVAQFVERTGWQPQRHAIIAGALPFTRYNFLIRFIMKRISKAAGGDTDTSRDYDYTDWGAVEAFAMNGVRHLLKESADAV